MKKVLSLFVACFFFISSSNLNAEISLTAKNTEPMVYTYCSDFANTVATQIALQGGNYYKAYFNAYGFCIEHIVPIITP